MRRFRLLLFLIFLAGLAWFGQASLLRWLGHSLILKEAPIHSDAIVVLAGDVAGERISKAAELFKQGWAPKIIVSSAGSFFDVTEGELAVNYAVRRGLPSSAVEVVQSEADSTAEEVSWLRNHLRKHGVKRFLLVSSDYHTRRAARVMRRNADGFELRVLGSKTEKFDPDTWWLSRPARKIWLLEAVKTLADLVGL